MNEKQRSEEYFAELSVHRSEGDANEANAEGLIFPQGEPVERTGVWADQPAGTGDSRDNGEPPRS